MGCTCGGQNGGGCGGGSAEARAPMAEIPPVEIEDSAVVGIVTPSPETAGASASSEWPTITVNGMAIEVAAIAREMQYHPASTREEAVYLASQALVLRELLQQRIQALGILVRAAGGESEEEAAIRVLLEREVSLPAADDASCRQYFEQNRARFASAPLLALRHILLGCAPDDLEARENQRQKAGELLLILRQEPWRFEEFALRYSDCPSRAQGGALGQISKGQTVPEFERAVFRLEPGLAMQPVESRYGFHLVQIEQRIEGRELPYEAVSARIRELLEQRVWQTGVRQYLQQLVGAADIRGIHLEGASDPLVQ